MLHANKTLYGEKPLHIVFDKINGYIKLKFRKFWG